MFSAAVASDLSLLQDKLQLDLTPETEA